MAQIGIFSGAALASPDDKGRLALPAILRNSVPGDGKSRTLFITTHEVAPCLVGSGADRIAAIPGMIERAADLAAQRGDAFDRFAMERRLYGPGEEVPIDGSGRFVLSDMLSEIGEFSGEIFFFGTGATFEMWDVARLLDLEGDSYAAVQQAARAALRVKAKKAQKA